MHSLRLFLRQLGGCDLLVCLLLQRCHVILLHVVLGASFQELRYLTIIHARRLLVATSLADRGGGCATWVRCID